MSLLTWLADKLPMTFVEYADFDDLVSGKPINIYRDIIGRKIMATSATSDDRVECPPEDLHINYVINDAKAQLKESKEQV